MAGDVPKASALGELSLEGLMERYVDGDANAFEALYQRVSSKLFGYLVRLTRERAPGRHRRMDFHVRSHSGLSEHSP